MYYYILPHSKPQQYAFMSNMLFSFDEMVVKCTGVNGLRKAHLHIHKSKRFNSLNIYLGVGNNWNGSMLVRGITKYCRIYMEHQSKTSDYILLCITVYYYIYYCILLHILLYICLYKSNFCINVIFV